jgi:hypothetical protein
MTRIQRHPGEVPYLLGRVTAGDRKTLSSLVRLGLYVGALAFGGQGNISTQIFVSECESPVCGWGRAKHSETQSRITRQIVARMREPLQVMTLH